MKSVSHDEADLCGQAVIAISAVLRTRLACVLSTLREDQPFSRLPRAPRRAGGADLRDDAIAERARKIGGTSLKSQTDSPSWNCSISPLPSPRAGADAECL